MGWRAGHTGWKIIVRFNRHFRRTSMKRLFMTLTLAMLALPVFAQTGKTLLNLDADGVAIQGYDPVAFFTDHKPVKGDPKFLAKHDGAIYFFASQGAQGHVQGRPGQI